ncbi:MAG: sn-glycerol-3-phosphate ABC transporter ATP-binding protein UgpC [Desulfobacula sp.]|uniref:ABC transporter ATP-binding protein n=1 Tax=Desulfobacula sp. TaxID=2593537 RepID=UPI0025C4F5AE|nr:sn-glycerol-3-phosphate ABC transporter ATP-binding protein UgpC [Desulfobacula sp.]MCD4718733.1 sn-glycerol-3-phosphate ABC transporter ATP-binding protein UgpC [Desulfobacula sp.]
MTELRFKDVIKKYGKTEVIHGINLDIKDKEFLVLVGPSGCGKSTLLRMVAGLEEISSGTISIDDKIVNDIAPKDRGLAMVFQNYALYPHMNVFNNMSFGLKLSKTPKPEIKQRVEEVAVILGIEDLLTRKPHELSGGQRQRVAMGRAMVRKPSIFLFDEPLSNLDAKLRIQMRAEIKMLHQRVNSTIIYVTHDQIEAMTLADRIVVLKDGYIEQVGSPLELFSNPVNTFVAGFIGTPPMNLVECTINKKPDNTFIQFKTELKIPVPDKQGKDLVHDQKVILGLRAEDLTPVNSSTSLPKDWIFSGSVMVVEPLGNETHLHMDIMGVRMMSKSEGRQILKPNETIKIGMNLNEMHLFDAKTTRVVY